jgi:hypothetical protein
MILRVQVCDRCEKSIGETDMPGVVTMAEAVDTERFPFATTKTYVLCRECYRDVRTAIGSIAGEQRGTRRR